MITWLKQKLGFVYPRSWDICRLGDFLKISVRRSPFRLIHIYPLFHSSVAPLVLPMFKYIFSTNNICGDLCIWCCVFIDFEKIIILYTLPKIQVPIYWTPMAQIILPPITSPNILFCTFIILLDSARQDISINANKIGPVVKMCYI